MVAQHLQTAILIFGRCPRDEAEAKAWLGQRAWKQNLRLAQTLSGKTRKLANASGLPVVIFDSKRQQGQSFAERFSHALEQTFQAGFEKVIAIGTDCPALRIEHIWQANQGLEHQQVVLGPDHRGGIYLLGLRRAAFSSLHLEEITWHSPFVFKELIAFCPQGAGILEQLSDLNKFDQLKRKATSWSFLKRTKWLLDAVGICLQTPVTTTRNVLLLSMHDCDIRLLRGPPVISY